MPEQLNLKFSKNTIHNINIYHKASKTESIGSNNGQTSSINVQFTPTQRQALLNILKEHNIKASTFIREMVDTYIELFPYREKIKNHKKTLIEILKSFS
ncbi:hypothetical protein KAR91_29055 [Candidatus Pacearchaeota archaeon]|nr:hypothetical protein [Candidatus Pacearchaeota archaeon]